MWAFGAVRWLATALIAAMVLSNVMVLIKRRSPLWHHVHAWRPRFRVPNGTETRAAEPPDGPAPLLTLVMATRNDGYGGLSSQTRVGTTLRMIDRQAGRYNVSVELLIVEWNPPLDRPPVAATLPLLPSVAVVRVVSVPPWVHAAWTMPHKAQNVSAPPLLEFIAKNIGIRRARGTYIMGHALDTILCDNFWRDLAAGLLEKTEAAANGGEPVLHRLTRVDSAVRLSGTEPLEEVERRLGESIKTVWFCQGAFRLEKPAPLMAPMATAEGTVRFVRELQSGPACVAESVRSARDCSTSTVRECGLVFTEASGDFELMSMKGWLTVRGFLERATYGHFDSLLVIKALPRNIPIVGHFWSSDASLPESERGYWIWHQGHDVGGMAQRVQEYGEIETYYQGFLKAPFWQENEEREWGMPEFAFSEVEWNRGVLVHGSLNMSHAARDGPEVRENNKTDF